MNPTVSLGRGLMAEKAVTWLAQLANMVLAYCFAPSVARLFKMRAGNFIAQGVAQIWWGICCHSVQIGLMIPTKGAGEVTVAAWINACWQDERCFRWLKAIAGMKGRSLSVTDDDAPTCTEPNP
jgi:hypothetical protein